MVAAGAVTVLAIGAALTALTSGVDSDGGTQPSSRKRNPIIALSIFAAAVAALDKLAPVLHGLIMGTSALTVPALVGFIVQYMFHGGAVGGLASVTGGDSGLAALANALVVSATTGALVTLVMMAVSVDYGLAAERLSSRLGPLGCIAVGAASAGSQDGRAYSWDCWKPILREYGSPDEPSATGMLLRDVVDDPRVRLVRAEGLPGPDGQVTEVPDIVLENMWGDRFQIQFLILRDGPTRLAAHAAPIFHQRLPKPLK